jgi:hypothetical protein
MALAGRAHPNETAAGWVEGCGNSGSCNDDVRTLVAGHLYSPLFSLIERSQKSGTFSRGGASGGQAFGPEIA